MNNLIHGNIKPTSPSTARPIINLAIVSCMLLLCQGTVAVADGFDLRNLQLDAYTYPASQTTDKRQEDFFVNLTMLSRDSLAEVVKFYEDMGLRVETGEQDGVTPGRILFEKRMLAANTPLRVIITTGGSDEYHLDDDHLYHDLESIVVTGMKTQDQLNAVRQRFDSLLQAFYLNRPSYTLSDCRSAISDASEEQEDSMEERGRRLQELAMQGRMDELQKEMEGFGGPHIPSSDELAGDKWDGEIECLEELERESYSIRIDVVSSRDNVLG